MHHCQCSQIYYRQNQSIIEEHTVDSDITAVAENDEAKLNKTVTLNLRI